MDGRIREAGQGDPAGGSPGDVLAEGVVGVVVVVVVAVGVAVPVAEVVGVGV